MLNPKKSFLVATFLLVFAVAAQAQPNRLEGPRYEMPMPTHPAFSAYDYGQLFVRVTPADNGRIGKAELVGIELMAADTVAFHFVDPALFDETYESAVRGKPVDLEVRLLQALVVNRSPALRLRESDLRRSRGQRCPRCPEQDESYEEPSTERPVVITVRLKRE